MNIVLYGAGACGRQAANLIQESYPEFQKSIVGFLDRKKSGAVLGHPILSMKDDRLRKMSAVITLRDFSTAYEAYQTLQEMGLEKIWWFNSAKHILGKDDFLAEQCMQCENWDGSVLPKVEMHIIDACNLNCRGCAHFSPIFPNTLPNFEARMNDVNKLRHKFSYIEKFYILGGEPFLNPEIDRYCYAIRRLLPNSELFIVTNGLLLPNIEDDVFFAIRDSDISVCVTEYHPTHKIIDAIKGKLESFNIKYEIRAEEVKSTFNKPLSLKSDSIYPQKCISNGCTAIWNGYISRCPTLLYIKNFNQYFGTFLPVEGTISLDDKIKGFDLLDKLKEKVPLCKHCVCNEIPWSVCGKNVTIEDFATVD